MKTNDRPVWTWSQLETKRLTPHYEDAWKGKPKTIQTCKDEQSFEWLNNFLHEPNNAQFEAVQSPFDYTLTLSTIKKYEGTFNLIQRDYYIRHRACRQVADFAKKKY
jgi:hypothetical protein